MKFQVSIVVSMSARPQLTQAQLSQLYNQYCMLVEQVRQTNPESTKGMQLINRARQIKEVLQAYSPRRQGSAPVRQQMPSQPQSAQPKNGAQMPQQMMGMNQVAGQQNPPVGRVMGDQQHAASQPSNSLSPQMMQHQLAQQQMRAQQGQQVAMASMQQTSGLHQRRSAIEDLRRAQVELQQRIDHDEQALRNCTNPEEAQRFHQNIQLFRNRFEQCHQRETQLIQELRALLSRQPRGAVGRQQTPVQQGVGQLVQQPSSLQQTTGQTPLPPQDPARMSQGQVQTQAQPSRAQSIPPQGNAVSANVAGPDQGSGSSRRSPIIRGSLPSLPITSSLSVAQPIPVNVHSGRPTLTNGSASTASALNSPALARIPPFEVNGNRLLSKRKLNDLVAGILGEDHEALIDGDVEELLLDLADEFISSVTSFACKIARHRKSDVLEVKDIQLHLEHNWNIRIPGYSSDEIRSIRKVSPTQGYLQKLNALGMNRSVNR